MWESAIRALALHTQINQESGSRTEKDHSSIISHHRDHSCLIYQEMFFSDFFLSRFGWVCASNVWLIGDANTENIAKRYRNIILSCLNKGLRPRLGNFVTFLLSKACFGMNEIDNFFNEIDWRPSARQVSEIVPIQAESAKLPSWWLLWPSI